jgi:hypothetical protein
MTVHQFAVDAIRIAHGRICVVFNASYIRALFPAGLEAIAPSWERGEVWAGN